MIDLNPDQVRAMPVDQLGLLVLQDLYDTGAWSLYNYDLAVQGAYQGEARAALLEAVGWLMSRVLIVPDRAKGDNGFRVSREGLRVLSDGPGAFYAGERIQGYLHPLIEPKARPQFLIGEYESAVFNSMKAVEVRVRQLAGFGDDAHGTRLMIDAFREGGPLRDAGQQAAEAQATQQLFTGAYGVLRNPSGHREVDYEDVNEAAEAVQMASFLMRILDRVEARLRGP